MYVVRPQGGTWPSTLSVLRGTSTVPLDVTATIDSSMTPFFETIDFIDCNCQSSWAMAPFDLWKVTLAGAQRGDLVDFGPGAELTTVAVTDPGPCTPAVWPGEFREDGVCGLAPHCHPTQPYSRGCATDATSPLALAPLLGLIALGRRRR
jgi:MYXO-CTERM domain-containing protein